jgi:ankyrin repeat protein
MCKMETHSCISLCEAARYNHDTCIQKFISEGADPNAIDIFGMGWTPLQWASNDGSDTCLKILIAAGVNITVTDEFGRTPLHWAVDSHTDRVQTLIDAGADPNIADDRGGTPLHYAALSGYDACIQALVAAGANPDITDVRGKTPLHSAVCYGREKCVRKLIDSGAVPDVYDNEIYTPLQLAVEKGHKECANLLAVRMLADLSLTNDEWDFIPPGSDVGHLLPVVMTRDGRDAAGKLVARLSEEKQKVLETVAMCVSHLVPRDLAEQILVRCV